LCKKCGCLLEVVIEYKGEFSWDRIGHQEKSIWRYKRLLPIPEGLEIISLGEGCTPLVKAIRLKDFLGTSNVYVKFEGANPTGSFKDRGMSLAVSLARYAGIDTFIVASTGNTSASAAAYVARASGKCIVLVPHGNIALGKLAQAMLHGAHILEVNGSFDDALSQVLKVIGNGEALYPLNSINPWRLEGQKTIGYEIIEFLGDVPDWIVVPVGNAGNIYAIGKGIMELYNLGLIDHLPRLAGVQAEGAAPLAKFWRNNLSNPVFIDNPDTIATAIRIGKPVNWRKAINMVKAFNGIIIDVSDSDIIEAQKILARYVGIGSEPAGAASLAGLISLINSGEISKNDRVVCVVTGHALKDPEIIVKGGYCERIVVDPNDVLQYIRRIVGE